MLTYKIHLIRHGLTSGNLEGRFMGQRDDLSLCEEGRKEIEKLVEEFDYPKIQKLYISPMKRCQETADIIYPNTYRQEIDDLKEFDFGDFSGRKISELKSEPEFIKFVEGKENGGRAPNGESTTEFNARCKRALETIFYDMMENKITNAGVVVHGGVIMSLLSQFSLPRQNYYDWVVENGMGFTVLMTPQMWLRDEGFEVYHKLPYRIIEDYSDNDNAE